MKNVERQPKNCGKHYFLLLFQKIRVKFQNEYSIKSQSLDFEGSWRGCNSLRGPTILHEAFI